MLQTSTEDIHFKIVWCNVIIAVNYKIRWSATSITAVNVHVLSLTSNAHMVAWLASLKPQQSARHINAGSIPSSELSPRNRLNAGWSCNYRRPVPGPKCSTPHRALSLTIQWSMPELYFHIRHACHKVYQTQARLLYCIGRTGLSALRTTGGSIFHVLIEIWITSSKTFSNVLWKYFIILNVRKQRMVSNSEFCVKQPCAGPYLSLWR